MSANLPNATWHCPLCAVSECDPMRRHLAAADVRARMGAIYAACRDIAPEFAIDVTPLPVSRPNAGLIQWSAGHARGPTLDASELSLLVTLMDALAFLRGSTEVQS